MKKLVISNNGQVILHEAREPQIETRGAIVHTSFALISSGTELSIIKWNKLMNLPIYQQFIKSKYIRKRVFSELKKNTIKNVFKLFRIYKERIPDYAGGCCFTVASSPTRKTLLTPRIPTILVSSRLN